MLLELRIIIYKCYLCNNMLIHLVKVRDNLRDSRRFNEQSTLIIALLSISKVINKEVTSNFYDKNI